MVNPRAVQEMPQEYKKSVTVKNPGTGQRSVDSQISSENNRAGPTLAFRDTALKSDFIA